MEDEESWIEDAEASRQEGNECFGKGIYNESTDCYTRGIQILETELNAKRKDRNEENGGEMNGDGKKEERANIEALLCKLYANRSLAYLRMGSLDLALQDANNCIRIDSTWMKGYVRKGMALEEMGFLREAVHVYKGALEQSKGDPQEELEDYIKGRIERVQDTAISQFIDWLVEGSALLHEALEVYSDSTGDRGVFLQRAIPKRSCVIAIPRELLITVEMGRSTKVGEKLDEDYIYGIRHTLLSIYILTDMYHERVHGQKSNFRPYYNALPSRFPTMPILWRDLSVFKGSHFMDQVWEKRECIQSDYDEVCRMAPEFQDMATIEDFVWARLIVASRNFGIMMDGERTDALVPFADLLNHKRPRRTKWMFNNRLDCFEVSTIEDLEEGMEVFDSYGKKCNSRYLLNYGFVVEDNRDPDGTCHNELHIEIDVSQDDPLYTRKIELLGEEPSLQAFRFSMNYADASTQETVSYLRFVCATTEAEIAHIPPFDEDTDFTEDPIPMLSLENERKVLSYLREHCEKQYAKYECSYEDDQAWIASCEKKSESQQYLARVLLAGEKEICLYYMKLPEDQWPPFQQGENGTGPSNGDTSQA